MKAQNAGRPYYAVSMTPAMIIPMIAGPQGTQTEDYAVHLSPQAKLPRTIYVLLSSLCLCPNTNIYVRKYKYYGYK